MKWHDMLTDWKAIAGSMLLFTALLSGLSFILTGGDVSQAFVGHADLLSFQEGDESITFPVPESTGFGRRIFIDAVALDPTRGIDPKAPTMSQSVVIPKHMTGPVEVTIRHLD